MDANFREQRKQWKLFFTNKGVEAIFHEHRKWVLSFTPNKGSGALCIWRKKPRRRVMYMSSLNIWISYQAAVKKELKRGS